MVPSANPVQRSRHEQTPVLRKRACSSPDLRRAARLRQESPEGPCKHRAVLDSSSEGSVHDQFGQNDLSPVSTGEDIDGRANLEVVPLFMGQDIDRRADLEQGPPSTRPARKYPPPPLTEFLHGRPGVPMWDYPAVVNDYTCHIEIEQEENAHESPSDRVCFKGFVRTAKGKIKTKKGTETTTKTKKQSRVIAGAPVSQYEALRRTNWTTWYQEEDDLLYDLEGMIKECYADATLRNLPREINDAYRLMQTSCRDELIFFLEAHEFGSVIKRMIRKTATELDIALYIVLSHGVNVDKFLFRKRLPALSAQLRGAYTLKRPADQLYEVLNTHPQDLGQNMAIRLFMQILYAMATDKFVQFSDLTFGEISQELSYCDIEAREF